MKSGRKRSSPDASVASALERFLRSLPHVGYDGFEGLVAALLEAETGRRFRLQKSGSQHGMDGEADRDGGAVLSFEAKHYLASGRPELRSLLGELMEVSNMPLQPDLWLLATTAVMSPSDLREIDQAAAKLGFDTLCLDAGAVPRLHTLMAAHPEVIARFDRSVAEPDGSSPLMRELAAVRALPTFDADYSQLRRALDTTLLGFEDAAARAGMAIQQTLASVPTARRRFGQDVAVRGPASGLVRRTAVAGGLSAWLAGPALQGRHLALVGEEGSGKTWAAFDWLADLGGQPLASWLVLPMSASAERIGDRDTLDDLLPRLLSRWAGPAVEDGRWDKRLQRWLGADDGHPPRILVVIDGLNERTDVDWPAFLAPALLPERAGRIAVLVVDRPIHWSERCDPKVGGSFRQTEVASYSDAELAQALRGGEVRLDDIPDELQGLIRLPRYCGLVCRHYAEMVRDGDCTRARLLYLDLCSRAAAKDHYPLSGAELQDAIVEAARHHRAAASGLSRREIAELAPSGQRGQDVVEELLTSGVLVPVDGQAGRFRVEPLRLSYAMGLLLAEHLAAKARSGAGAPALAEAVAQWFEPEPSADLKVDAAAAALFHALVDKGYPVEARRELLLHWLRLRNWDDALRVAVLGYVRRIPDDFVAAAERLWPSADSRGAGQDAIGRAFAQNRDDPAVLPVLVRAAERWLGLVHADGPETRRDDGGSEEEQVREAIERRLGRPAEPGTTVHVLGVPLHVTGDDGLMRLRRLAIVLLAAGRRAPFLPACVAWAASSAVMGSATEAETMAWALRLTDEDLAGDLLPDCRRLVEAGELGADASRHLLRCLGTRDARQLAESRPGPPNEYHQRLLREHDADPCTSWFALEDGQHAACLARADVSVRSLIGKTKRLLLDPDWPVPSSFLDRVEAELAAVDPAKVAGPLGRAYEDHLCEELGLVLAARRPEALAAFYRRVVGTTASRPLDGLQGLGQLLPQVTPALNQVDADPVLDVVRRLDLACEAQAEGERDWQQKSFVSEKLLAGILGLLTTQERAAAITGRPEGAFNSLDLEHWIEPLPSSTQAELLAVAGNPAEGPKKRLRALWLLGACPPLAPDVAACVTSCCSDTDLVLRGVALRIAWRTRDASLGRSLAAGTRPLQAKRTSWEASYGSSLVALWGGFLSVPDLAARLHPAALTYALGWQDRDEADAGLAASFFDLAWSHVSGAASPQREPPPVTAPAAAETAGMGRPTMPSLDSSSVRIIHPGASWRNFDDPLPELDPARNADAQLRRLEEREQQLTEAWGTDAYAWHAMGFDAGGLGKMVRARPDLAQRWAEGATADGLAGKRNRLRLASFHDTLAAALFEAGHPLALPFWRTLFQHADCKVDGGAAAAAFAGPSTPASDAAKAEVLAACQVDKDLQEVTLTAMRSGKAAWLDGAIKALAGAPQLWRKATSLTLASFAGYDQLAFAALVQKADVGGTWVGDCADDLERRVETNAYARAYHARFWQEADRVAAWGAFRMVLATADDRFHAWRHEVEPAAPTGWKPAFVACSKAALERAIKERVGADDKLFGTSLDRVQVFPFA